MNNDIVNEFLTESREHLETVEEELLKLEQDSRDSKTINELFRAIHSIKGGAGFFGFTSISELAHDMENLLYKARGGELLLENKHIDVLFAGLDRLKEVFTRPEEEADISDIQEQLAALAGPIEDPVKVEIQGKVFDKNDDRFRKFKINEKELKKAVDSGMEIYAVSAYIKKDMHDKGKTPYQYTEQISELGYFIDSYLDIENVPVDKDQDLTQFDMPFAFLFATVMDENLVEVGVEVDTSQIVHIDTAPFKETVKVKGKNGEIIDVGEKGKDIDDARKGKKKKTAKKTADGEPENTEGAIQVEETLRVKVSKLNKLVNLAGELVLGRNQLLSIAQDIRKDAPGLHGILQSINLVTTELQTEIMNTRMQPVSLVFGKFPRMLRDLSQKLGKKIRLEMEGVEVEVDKTIIEAISDPLTHLVRNVVDHAIEMPEERIQLGKDEEGLLHLRAYHEGGLVNIRITDDGKGIDPAVVIEKALKQRLVTAEEAARLSDKEKINFIFAPGFSTAKTVTDVSGRGVGMDVVKTNIEKLGGSVDLESIMEQGTNVKIQLPLTLAIVTSLIVETEKQKFAIPQVSIEELIRIKPEEFGQRIAGIQGGQVLRIRGNLLPLIHLADSIKLTRTFEHPVSHQILPEKRKRYSTTDITEEGDLVTPGESASDQRQPTYSDVLKVLIVKSGDNHFGLIVDKIIGSEEIVVKPMPQHFRHLQSYAGATILGDGRVSLIIDVPGLAQKNKLLLREAETLQSKQESTAKVREEEGESVNLLMFDLGTSERFAVPVGLIERVDVMDSQLIEMVGDKSYSSYKGFSMRLLHLPDYIDVQPPDTDVSRYRVIIPKNTDIPVGLLIHNIVDTKEIVIKLEENVLRQKGVIGSAVIDKKITRLLDLLTVIETAEPGSLRTLREKEDVRKAATLLLVEDTRFYLELVAGYLRDEGYQVITALDGVEALEQLGRHKFDLVVSDIEMPNMDGFKLIEKIREDEALKSLPVIALTSLHDEKVIRKGKEAGFEEWCVKLNKEELRNVIRKYLK